jgi:hypothetical protein
MVIYCESSFAPDGFNNYWVSSAANPPSVRWGYYKRGDVDGDGEFTTTDYILIKRYIMGTYSCTKAQKLACDLEGDRVIGTEDYIKMKRVIMNTYTLR